MRTLIVIILSVVIAVGVVWGLVGYSGVMNLTGRTLSIRDYGEVVDSQGNWRGIPTGLAGPAGPPGPQGPPGAQEPPAPIVEPDRSFKLASKGEEITTMLSLEAGDRVEGELIATGIVALNVRTPGLEYQGRVTGWPLISVLVTGGKFAFFAPLDGDYRIILTNYEPHSIDITLKLTRYPAIPIWAD
jgi:hypothetical protein